MVQKVISSGETGVARAALRAASASGVMVGGWCPPDLLMERALLEEYALLETQREGIADAAEWNVRDSDVTLVFLSGDLAMADPLSKQTIEAAHHFGKALLVCDPDDAQVPTRIVQWLQKTDAWTVNIAGPSETAAPGIDGKVHDLLCWVFGTEKTATELADSISSRKENPDLQRSRMQNDAAWKIRRARAQAGLNQLDLANRMGTSRSAIYRLEDPGYWGHSLPVLRRLAAAVGKRLEIRFVPNGEEHPSGPEKKM